MRVFCVIFLFFVFSCKSNYNEKTDGVQSLSQSSKIHSQVTVPLQPAIQLTDIKEIDIVGDGSSKGFNLEGSDYQDNNFMYIGLGVGGFAVLGTIITGLVSRGKKTPEIITVQDNTVHKRPVDLSALEKSPHGTIVQSSKGTVTVKTKVGEHKTSEIPIVFNSGNRVKTTGHIGNYPQEIGEVHIVTGKGAVKEYNALNEDGRIGQLKFHKDQLGNWYSLELLDSNAGYLMTRLEIANTVTSELSTVYRTPQEILASLLDSSLHVEIINRDGEFIVFMIDAPNGANLTFELPIKYFQHCLVVDGQPYIKYELEKIITSLNAHPSLSGLVK